LPWHGWEFDVRTGRSVCDPAMIRLRKYAVDIAAGQHVVDGPYTAETVPVKVEEPYIVVEI
jgi:nitrite reductase/ring-hydroxylating ferredoxin subunit